MGGLGDVVDELRYEIDDVDATRYTTTQVYFAIDEALRNVVRSAHRVNPDFIQYSLGGSTTVYRAVNVELYTPGVVTLPAGSGTADIAADNPTNTLLDATQEWVENEWVGYTLTITGGTSAGDSFTIASNTISILTVQGTWTINLDATSTYDINTPSAKVYASTLGRPWRKDAFAGAFIRITAGTGIGQERKIDSIGGYEMTVDSPWIPALANADTFEIIGLKKSYALPSDYFRMQTVEVDGVEISEMDPSGYSNEEAKMALGVAWSIKGDYLHIEGLGGGEIIQLHYTPTITPASSLTTQQTVPMSTIFGDAIKYYAKMKLKGSNEEDLRTDAQFFKPISDAMMKAMTDINVESKMAIESPFEEFPG